MSLLSGFFTLPSALALYVYKRMRFELSLWQGLESGSEIIRKADPRYAQLLSDLVDSQIKNEMQEFLDKARIRKDLIFVETPNLGICSASGTNFFKNGDAVIEVAPGFYEFDKDACKFVMKHEISHIKHNDFFTTLCVPCVCQLAASIFGMCFLSFLPALVVAFAVSIVSYALFSQWREAKADDFAIENSSVEELKGGRRFFIAFQKVSIEERNTFWKRITISPGGDMRLDISHPSITSRIQKIEMALRAKNININVEKQMSNARLIIFIANKKREIGRAIEQAGGIPSITNPFTG